MNNNQDFVSFPFRPHLAQYLFYTIKNKAIESEEALYKNLDISLKSPDGFMLRTLMERADFPVKDVKYGFRLTVRIPKQSRKNEMFTEDGRCRGLVITEKAAKVINDFYETRFQDHFVSFVAGSAFGSKQKRGSISNAIFHFMETYQLSPENGFNFQTMKKYYDRIESPLKKQIYETKNRKTPANP